MKISKSKIKLVAQEILIHDDLDVVIEFIAACVLNDGKDAQNWVDDYIENLDGKEELLYVGFKL